MRRHLIIACVLAAALARVGLAAPDSETPTIEFKFAPRPGQVTTQRIVTKSVGSMKYAAPMPAMRFVQSFEQEIVSECKKVNPDRSSVSEMTFNFLAARMNMAGMNLEFDAKTFDPAQANDSMSKWMGLFYSAFNGSKVTATLKPDGTLAGMVGMREAFDRVMKKVKDNMGNDKMANMLTKVFEQMSAMFDDETMTEQMQSYSRMMPDKQGPVHVGDKWDRQWDMNMPVLNANCQVKGEYQLVGIEKLQGRPCAKIRLKETFQMTTDPNRAKGGETGASEPFDGLLDQLDMTLTSSGGEGIAYWDYQAGVLVQLRQTQRMTIEVKFNLPEKATATSAPGGFKSMVQEFHTSVAIDLIEGHAGASTQPQNQPGVNGPATAKP